MAKLRKELQERKRLVIWRQPRKTLSYFVRDVGCELKQGFNNLLKQRRLLILTAIVTTIITISSVANGPQQAYVLFLSKYIFRALYWIGLGFLSSAGFGSGLHTFVLYLGPHIASVTIAAYECDSVDFPEPPYPNEIICPEEKGLPMTIWPIMAKVRFDAMMWGLGTALGELPPFFMARAARLTGSNDKVIDNDDAKSYMNYAMKKMEYFVKNYGFIAILLSASIPNPIFDVAGMTCGHFLVPFWTFFGATMIGKAVIKMHLQQLFVIIAFNENLLEKALYIINQVPRLGPKLQEPIRLILEKQKQKLHGTVDEGYGFFKFCFDSFVGLMIVYFCVSIINYMAQKYHTRLCERKRGKKFP